MMSFEQVVETTVVSRAICTENDIHFFECLTMTEAACQVDIGSGEQTLKKKNASSTWPISILDGTGGGLGSIYLQFNQFKKCIFFQIE